MHVRASIVSLLTNELTANVAATVSRSRVYQIPAGTAATVLVYPTSETTESLALKPPRILSRKLSVAVEVIVRDAAQTDPLDATLDAYVEAVENAVYTFSQGAAPDGFKGLADDIELTSTTIQMSGEGDSPIASARLEYVITYRVREDAVGTPIPS